jgi:hypothetical protein
VVFGWRNNIEWTALFYFLEWNGSAPRLVARMEPLRFLLRSWNENGAILTDVNTVTISGSGTLGSPA